MAIASDKTKEYLQMLEEKFDANKFYEFIKDLLNLDSSNIINGKKQSPTSEQYKNYIDTTQLYAKYEDKKRRTIGVLIIKLQDNKLPANARTLQRNYIAHLLDSSGYNLDATLAVIYSETEDTWRLSFVKQELDFTEGKLKTKFTPAKRYSYLFGKDEPNHTAKEQLLELLENNNKQYTIEEIEEKFSVEKVTKDFFENYKENYLKLKEILEANDEFLSEANRCDFSSEEFTKKLMGQIVFIYFLQKKGWLGVRLVPQLLSIEEYNNIYSKSDIIQKKILDKYYITFNGSKKIKKDLLEKYNDNKQEIESLSDIFVNTNFDNKWGSGQKRFIRAIFDNCINRKKNFFDDYLEPFFYDGLNHKRKNQYFSLFNCKIPFLNGGLFEPLDNYQWEIARFNIDNKIFSNEEETGILDFFDRYNFTMNEEEPLEKDVAVDPEMLGKIFENLLDVKDRKSKGAFYTPREIVHFMCQESIANFLVNKVGVKYDEIKEFIQYGEMIRDIDLKDATKDSHIVGDSIFNNIVQIDKALENIKIADPSVGSGAFPLGILNEIVKIRDILTSYMLIYNRLGLFGKKYTEEQITNNKRSIYNIKWNTIKNSIYAVDVENSAVDITKLRLWLSIVVDQTEDPEPLPNLNCKIMQGNSLVDEFNGIKLIDEKFIDELKDRDNVKLNDGGRIKSKNRFIEVSSEQIQFGDGQKKAQIDDLINLKQELYGENDPNRKKVLLEKIQTARKELLRLNFAGTNKEKELFKLDESHNKPYFAWMLEFIEVFIENDGFDIVIGNPPYLESRNPEFDNEFKETLQSIIKKRFGKKAYYFPKGTDLLIYFFELANRLLCNKGINTFITENAWLDTEYGAKFQEYLMNNLNILAVIDSDYKYFETADINTVITIFKKDERIDNPISYYKVHSKNFNNCNILSETNDNNIDVRRFELGNELLKQLKWGFLFNAGNELIKSLNTMYKKGLIAEKGNCSIGQGLNLTKDYFVKDENVIFVSPESLIPIYTVDNNGELVWETKKTYIVDKDKNSKHNDEIKEFDKTKTTKIPPKIIMPRGVGSRHFASINKINGYSASYVDIYMNEEDEEKLYNIWLFCNSSLFWLIRESMGRTNLGGGMLKAEAIDLKNVPIIFNFNKFDEIKSIMNKLENYIVEDTTVEIKKDYHIAIDKLVFDYLEIDDTTREKLLEELVNKVNSRYKKMLK